MRIIFLAVPALLAAGTAVAQGGGRPNALDPQAKVPPVEFRSAYEWKGEPPAASRQPPAGQGAPVLNARKPSGHVGH